MKKKHIKLYVPILIVVFIAIVISQSSLVSTVPELRTSEERISNFPKKDFPVKGNVNVYWNEYLVPFIEADNDGAFLFAFRTNGNVTYVIPRTSG